MHDLNTEQKRAVEAGDGPVVIVAGPGTGKTKTLTARITYLIQTGRAKPSEILALTFTKKAAEEMAVRVGQAGATICTFHALCHTLLGDVPGFIPEPERLAIIKQLPKPSAFKGVPVRELSLRISRAKNLAEAGDAPLATLVAAYDAALAEHGAIDFDDLLLRARDYLAAHPEARPHYTYILVDEFQDTNVLQYQLLNLLRRNSNVFVIGDPNQSIYGFRGASGGIFAQFLADFPDSLQVTLSVNYRSAPQVVAISNAVFASSSQLRAHNTHIGHVRAFELLNEYSEAHWVTGQISQAIGGVDLLQASHVDATRSLRDFAILYRNRHVGTQIKKYIEQSGVPYQVVGDGSPYDRPDVQTLIALLRCVAGMQTPVPNFTTGQVATLLQNINTNAKPVDIARWLQQTFHLRPNADLAHVTGTLVRFTTLAEVIQHFDALASSQFYDPAAEAVTLLTIHASKGLEFPHVFLAGCEEGVLPGEKADEQEERRLFYVAVTRAKDQLDITYVTRRDGKPAKPSRFITELPANVLPRQQDPNLAADTRRLQKRQAKKAQTSLF